MRRQVLDSSLKIAILSHCAHCTHADVSSIFDFSGLGATAFYMVKGWRAAGARDGLTLAHMLQKRVIVQFGTVVVIIGTFVYIANTSEGRASRQKTLDEKAAIDAQGEYRFNSISKM